MKSSPAQGRDPKPRHSQENSRRRRRRRALAVQFAMTESDHIEVDAAFFEPEAEQVESEEQTLLPEHLGTLVWRSQGVKLRDEYHRVRSRLKFIAPAVLSEHPFRTPEEYRQHKISMIDMALREKEKDILVLKERLAVHEKIPQNGRTIKPAFGGKVFDDHLTPVLALPSIWSNPQLPIKIQPQWPSRAELLWNGQNEAVGRLPPVRDTTGESKSFQDQSVLKPYAFDQTGAIFNNYQEYVDMLESNAEMDCDEHFQDRGQELLGSDLMAEIGEWKAPLPSEWKIQQVIANCEMQTNWWPY